MTRPRISAPEVARIVRFLLVGLSSTGLYFGLLALLRGSIGNVSLLAAVCYGVSMIYNYVLQSWFTFRAGRPTGSSVLRFVTMHLSAMALNSALMQGLVTGAGVPLFPAQILVTALISIYVFVISKQWVYRHAIASGRASV